MKQKSLVIMSFAFIFLLSMSIVSAGWFSELFSGKATGSSIRNVGLDGDPGPSVPPLPSEESNFRNLWGLFDGPLKPVEVPTVPVGSDTILPREDLAEDVGGDSIGGNGCDLLEIEELVIYPGDVGENGGVLNNRYVDFNDNEELIIDETYAYPLTEGGKYLVPIPNQECYWEASYEDGELYMVTVCNVAEESLLELDR